MSSTRVAKATVKSVFDSLDTAIRRGEYSILGQVTKILTPKGEMLFRGKGPMIAQLESGALVFLTEWQGLPEIPVLLDLPCPACAVKCEHCEGSGKNVCTLYGCGGTGERRIKMIPCTAAGCLEQTKRTNLKCKSCYGRGEESVPEECPQCKGAGKMSCSACFGTGQRGTGVKEVKKVRKHFAPYAPTVDEKVPCVECDGQGRKCKVELQDPKTFADRQISGYQALGPIDGIIWQNLDDGVFANNRTNNSRFAAGGGRYAAEGRGSLRGKHKDFVICDVEPTEQGQPMYLFVKEMQAGSSMYLLGGRAAIRE